MTQFSLYSYAWDIEEIGAQNFAAECRDLGLNGVTLACSYHAGKFLRPHGLNGKVYFPEDGTVYFKHRSERYTAIHPQAWSGLDEFDPLHELQKAAPDLARTAWVVCCHNSRIGLAHPEITAQNCFGDHYIYSLNPAHPQTRDYVVSLCRDIADGYDVDGLVLETPGWLPYAHGYHHEFAMRPIDPWLAHGLGLCFAPETIDGAKQAGLDALALKKRLAAQIETVLRAGLAVDDGRAAEWLLGDFATDPEWCAYHCYRQSVVTSLVAEIKDALPQSTKLRVIPSVRRPTAGAWREGGDLAGLIRVCDGLEICAYEPDANAVALDAIDVRKRIGKGSLSAVIRPSFPDLASGTQGIDAAQTLLNAGVEELNFYNYGHMDKPSLKRIQSIIGAVS